MTEISLSAVLHPTQHTKDKMLSDEKFTIDQAVKFMFERDSTFPVFNYTEYRYAQFLKNKTVIIIGGADGQTSIPVGVGMPDVFVRINGHLPRQGGSCHVLYHTGVANPDIHPSLISYMDKIEFVFLNSVDGQYEVRNRSEPVYVPFLDALTDLKPKAHVGFFAQGEWLEKNPYGPEQEWLNDLHKKYSCKLFTGNVALAHIMRFQPAKIFVTGMTMYVEKTGGNREGKIESHETEGNLRFLKDASIDPRVVFSEEFKKALNAYKF